jgi:hypothetical protein
LADLRNALRFTLAAAQVPSDHTRFWYDQDPSLEMGDSRSREDFDWLVDCYLEIYPGHQEVAFDILFLLGVMKVRCIPAKQHQFIESLVACMGTTMPVHWRYAALRATNNLREEIALIDTIDAELRDMVLTKLSPAILTTVCPQPGTTLANDPHHFFNEGRDLCYLKLIFALARNSNWHPHLLGDHHIDRCISIIEACCLPYLIHAFYLVGILLRTAPERLSIASLDGVTEQQWWDVMRSAWRSARYVIDDRHCFEFLPVLVEGTKRHMHNASKNDLEWLIGYVDGVLKASEKRDSKQGEDECIVVAVKEFSDMLKKSVNSEGVISP